MSITTTIHATAAENGGVTARRMLIERGVPERAVDNEVRLGRLLPIHPGVYRAVGTPDDRALRLRAALLATAPHGVLSHRTAIRILGVTSRFDCIELTVPHNCRPRLDGVIVHRSLRMPDAHIRNIDGLRVTSVERALGDVGAVISAEATRTVAESAVVQRLTTVDRLFRHVDDHRRRGRNGIGVLRFVLEEWMLSERPPDSELEIAFARLVRAAGLPPAHHQFEVIDALGRLIGRADAAWPDQRVIVEVDGFSAHGTPTAMQRDLDRQNALVLAGWTVIRFTWHDIVRRPGWVAHQIASALAAAA